MTRHTVLPALHLPCKRDQPTDGCSFTRRPHWTRPLESLWGIFAKWQFVNCVPYSTIASCMLKRPAADAGTGTGVDFRILEGFNLDAIAMHGGVTRAALAKGACCRSSNSLVLAIASADLRFCPACLHDGFHATLFQFTPIVRCPIHGGRLHEGCLRCRAPIPYRLDAAFAARPFACPTCARSLLPEPTALAQPRRDDARHEHLQKWQRFLGHYAYWYANGKLPRHDNAGRFVHPSQHVTRNLAVKTRLSFVGALQLRLLEPPPLPLLASPTPTKPPSRAAPATQHKKRPEPGFPRHLWPHFHTPRFPALYRRYTGFHGRLERPDCAHLAQVTLWWRRSWEGAIARPCPAAQAFDAPPFGVAEWLAFASASASHPLTPSSITDLSLRFEQDLWTTWQAWAHVLHLVGADSPAGLHPRLVPPRACWLTEPPFETESPALGF